MLSAQNIIYVKPNGTGTGNTWANAIANLQAAIDSANQLTPKAKVWVASGTYFGDSIAANNAFTIKEGVNVYGGFAGNEPPNFDLSLRDFVINTSILEGQNVQRVLGQDSAFSDSIIITVWDGFTIQNGYNSNEGGGVKLFTYSKISNCVITNNTGRNGGGLWADRATIFNCKIINNSTTPYQGNYECGGGVYIFSSTMINCNISDNYADFGGGFWTRYSTFVNCNFSNNSSSTNVYFGGAGAGYVWASSTFINCLVNDNTTTGHCGGVYVHNWIDGPTDFINCHIVNNSGDGIYMQYSSAHTNIANCIIWGNDIQISGSNSRTISYSAIQGGASGTNNIDLSPENSGIDTTSNYVTFTDPINEDYSLLPQSVCVDTGLDSIVTTFTDILGNMRIWDGNNDSTFTVDIGAFEYGAPASSCITNEINILDFNDTLDFGVLQVELTFDTSSLWLSNVGGCNIIIDSLIGLQSPFFIDTVGYTGQILPGDSIEIPIIINKDNPIGFYSDTLNVFSNVIQCSNIDSGLVAYYPFNGNAYDESGNGHDGTVNGATLTTDRFENLNSAYSFDGNSDYITCGNWFNYQDFTLSLWVKQNVLLGDYTIIIDNNHTDYINWVIQSEPFSNTFGFGTATLQGVFLTLPQNVWNHLVFVKDGYYVRAYLNGVLQDETLLTTSNVNYCDPNLYIARYAAGGRFFSGKIDDIRMYNRVISNSEIYALYDESYITNVIIQVELVDTVQILPLVLFDSIQNVFCFGDASGSIDLAVSGGTTPYTYLWSNGEIIEDISGLILGQYSVTVTDANSVEIIETYTILEPFPISLSFLSTDVSCNGGNDAMAIVIPTGGTYFFIEEYWANSVLGDTASNLSSGTYSVTVTDSDGCIGVDSVSINEPVEMTIIGVTTDIFSTGNSFGAIGITVTGGTSPYSYLWSNGSSTEDIQNLNFGNYYVTVTDALGCVTSEYFYVAETTQNYSPWSVSYTSNNHTILILDTISITVLANPVEIGDYIGIFYDSLGTEVCSGFREWTGASTAIAAWGTDTNEVCGFALGEEFKWKIWDASENQIIEARATYMPPGGGIVDEGEYVIWGISGLASLNAGESQEIDLPDGWSYFSTYIDPFYPLMDSIFSDIEQNVYLVKNSAGDIYWPSFSINLIGDLLYCEGYQIKMDIADTLIVMGFAVEPENEICVVPQGWSFISYLRKASTPIIDMLNSILGDIIIVKNYHGDIYWPYWSVNLIGDMNPGEGYQIKTTVQTELTYPANNALTFWTCGDDFIDTRDNQIYSTVQIGNQCWMAENLDIGVMQFGNQEMTNDSVLEKYCYNNNLSMCTTYGGLYQWDEMMQYSSDQDNQGICPMGWHLPTHFEWCILETELDPQVECNDEHWRGVDCGTKLKQGGSSGFNALFSGIRNINGTFEGAFGQELKTIFWSSSLTSSTTHAWRRLLAVGSGGVNLFSEPKSKGFSVRCIKNEQNIYKSKFISARKPSYYSDIQNTGSNMTLGIPKTSWEIKPQKGSEIGIFSQNGELAGSSVFTGENTAITIWGNDELTSEIDGLQQDEEFLIKIWNGGDEQSLKIISWFEGDEYYETNKISIVEKLSNVIQVTIGTNYKLLQNSPNPFSEITEICFYLPEKAFVKIELFNLLGEKIETIRSDNFDSGNNTIVFDRKNLPAGTYFYRLSSGEFSVAKAMSIE